MASVDPEPLNQTQYAPLTPAGEELRDIFAGQAMTALLNAVPLGRGQKVDGPNIAKCAYDMADFLMNERHKRTQT